MKPYGIHNATLISTDSVFICGLCTHSFGDQTGYNAHMLNRHDIGDVTEWHDKDSVKVKKVNKWRWLWRQFLCVSGISKRPTVIYGLDTGSDDMSVEVGGFINEQGHFEINFIRPIK